ncbi:MAG: DUF4382 domain-containing protein [Nevskiaceae bacterium]
MSSGLRVAAGLVLALLAGCDQGTVQLDVGDAPVDDADRVVVQFTGVTLERTDGDDESFTFNPPRPIDLAAQVEGATVALLDGTSVQEGDFEAVRLRVSADGSGTDSFVEVGGIARPLLLAEIDRPRLRVARPFTVVRQEETQLIVDFDLRKSVHTPDSGTSPYELRPSLRVVDPEDVGAIAGTVSAALAGASGCRPAVYVYTGHSATANDEGSALPPFASARVRVAGADFFYRVPFLPAGNYTAAFTCNAAADDPQLDDTISFTGAKNVTVDEEATVTASFP